MSTAATIRKAIGGAVVAAVTTSYAVLNADAFDFHAVSGPQWQTVAIAAFAAFTAVYHLPNAVTDKVAALEQAAPAVVVKVDANPLTAALLDWADGVEDTESEDAPSA